MSHYFKKGDKIPLCKEGKAEIIEKLGEGGQGVVYRVKVNGKEYAMKWYHKNAILDQKRFYKNLENNIENKSPAPTFLWPLFLSEMYEGSFGYVMELRPSNYKEFSDFLLAKVHFQSLSAAICAALNIVNGFRELHRKGFSYQDINDGNFFIDPATGDVLICDNDNVAPYGESLGIAGKARYMAPEVVRNIKRPDVMSDRFSLAVVLFRILFLDHPLEGRKVVQSPCLTETLELKFYGKEPVFIFDRDDDSNRPVHGVHYNALRFWPMYPKFVRDFFLEALSKEVMMNLKPRPTDNEWQQLFVALRDRIVTCPCGGETFLQLDNDSICINCGMKIPKPPVLQANKKHSIALFPGKKLYQCHIETGSDDYRKVCAEVIRNPKYPTVWGLRNLSEDVWQVEDYEGNKKVIQPKEVCIVTKTKNIQFLNGNAYIEK